MADQYPIHDLAQSVAVQLGLQLRPAVGPIRDVLTAARQLQASNFFVTYAVQRGILIGERVLEAERASDHKMYYSGGLLEGVRTPTETLLISTPSRQITITYGVPREVGVLDVMDIPMSLALGHLYDIEPGHGGRPELHYNSLAPKPTPMIGIAQFKLPEPRLEETLKRFL
jgi:hypothetical protein